MNIEIKNVSAGSDAVASVRRACYEMKAHWTDLLESMPCRVHMYSKKDMDSLVNKKSENWIFIKGPNPFYGVIHRNKRFNPAYEVVCGDMIPDTSIPHTQAVKEKRLQNVFLMACSFALQRHYPGIVSWLQTNYTNEAGKQEVRSTGFFRQLFLDNFHTFILDRVWFQDQYPRLNALFVTLDLNIAIIDNRGRRLIKK